MLLYFYFFELYLSIVLHGIYSTMKYLQGPEDLEETGILKLPGEFFFLF